MKIKVCGLTDKNNIREIIALQPNYIGFIFYKESKRYAHTTKELSEYIKAIDTVQKVGVFVDANLQYIVTKIATYGLDMVQLHGNETPSFCHTLNHYIPVIKAFQIDEHFNFDSLCVFEQSCSYFLFDTSSNQYGGSGKTFDWALLNKYKLSKPFFLSGGISPASVSQIRQFNHPLLETIDINSRFESEPGIKNVITTKNFMHELLD